MSFKEYNLTDEDLKKLFLLLKENYCEDTYLIEYGEQAFYQFFGNQLHFSLSNLKSKEQLYSSIERLLVEYDPVVNAILRELLSPIIERNLAEKYKNCITDFDNDQPSLSGPDYGSYFR